MTYIIAEIGNNHNGSLEKAKLLVNEAINSGADAIKTQSFRGLDIVSPRVLMSDLPDWDDGKFKYWYQFIEDFALPLENHQELIDYTNSFDLSIQIKHSLFLSILSVPLFFESFSFPTNPCIL